MNIPRQHKVHTNQGRTKMIDLQDWSNLSPKHSMPKIRYYYKVYGTINGIQSHKWYTVPYMVYGTIYGIRYHLWYTVPYKVYSKYYFPSEGTNIVKYLQYQINIYYNNRIIIVLFTAADILAEIFCSWKLQWRFKKQAIHYQQNLICFVASNANMDCESAAFQQYPVDVSFNNQT